MRCSHPWTCYNANGSSMKIEARVQIIHWNVFLRDLKRFVATRKIVPEKSPGALHSASSKQKVELVRSMVKTDHSASLSAFATSLDLTECSVWSTRRKTKDLYTHKLKTIQTLTSEHKMERMNYCE